VQVQDVGEEHSQGHLADRVSPERNDVLVCQYRAAAPTPTLRNPRHLPKETAKFLAHITNTVAALKDFDYSKCSGFKNLSQDDQQFVLDVRTCRALAPQYAAR
jgi:hypothetical protein